MDEHLEEAVRRAQCGDRDAFGTVIQHAERTALAIAYGILLNAEDAREAAQQAWIRAWDRLDTLRDPARFVAWLSHIVRRTACDLRRTASREERKQRGSAECAPRRVVADPAEEMERTETRQRIETALESLDELSRLAVVLRYYEGHSSQRIGELLSLSSASVDMRLSRARATLRDLLRAVQTSTPSGDLTPKHPS